MLPGRVVKTRPLVQTARGSFRPLTGPDPSEAVILQGTVVHDLGDRIVLEDVSVMSGGIRLRGIDGLAVPTDWIFEPEAVSQVPRVELTEQSSERTQLTIDSLQASAEDFTRQPFVEPSLFGVTDGKAIGTAVEKRFKAYMAVNYDFDAGNTAQGIDFPGLNTDLKVTSVKQPQSSSPFSSIRQKVYGIGHNLLLFVYSKYDRPTDSTSELTFEHALFIDASHTGDSSLTKTLRDLIQRGTTEDTVFGVLLNAGLNIGLSEEHSHVVLRSLAREVLVNPPQRGYLALCSAMQWRLQYHPALDNVGWIADGGLVRLW